jgi:hypothetical protein
MQCRADKYKAFDEDATPSRAGKDEKTICTPD